MSEVKGGGDLEQLLIALDATCKLLECGITIGDRPSLEGVYAIANELQSHAYAVHRALIMDRESESDNRGSKLEKKIDELDELIDKARTSMFTDKLASECRELADDGE